MNERDGETIFQDALRRLDQAARHTRVDPEVLQRLWLPRAVLQFAIRGAVRGRRMRWPAGRAG